MNGRSGGGAGTFTVLVLVCVHALACASPDAPARPGAPAPELVATTLSGDTVALSSFRGRPLLVNLWATWCFPCRQETPYLQALHERFSGEGLVVVGVTMDAPGATAEIRAFVAEFGLTYPILRDPDMVAMQGFAAPGLPATFLIDREGVLRRRISGPLDENDASFDAALQELLR